MGAVVVVAVLMHIKTVIWHIRQSEKPRNIDTDPSISAGSSTSVLKKQCKKRLAGLKIASDWMNWRTKTDPTKAREKNVSGATICGNSIQQTTASVGTRQRTQIIQKCVKNFDSRVGQPHTSLSHSSTFAVTATAAVAPAAATVAAVVWLVVLKLVA